MRVSLNWLNDYVDIKSYTPKQVADILTHLGFEVEAIETIAPVSGDIVVGKILKSERHPNADTLWFCVVDVGESMPLEIVCGAPNAQAGKTVCVAKVGSTIANGLKIKATKIRGIVSNGMICAEDELGIGEDHTKIIELPDDTPIGISVLDIFKLHDTVLEINIPPNRPDMLGVIGVAREIAAKLNIPLKYPDISNIKYDSNLHTQAKLKVHINSNQDCPRYVALYIEDVNANVQSPVWMRLRLQACGIRPINLIVDITNYVMLEYAQPIHAFDYRFIQGNEIIVRRAEANEKIITLDGKERHLEPTDLLICDTKGPIALAGVMGGAHSEIQKDTKNIIIEVAAFNPTLIRKTSKKHAIRTEASYRFERGVNLHNLITVTKRVASLMQELYLQLQKGHGSDITIPKVACTFIDTFNNENISCSKIAVRISRLEQILGLSYVDQNKVIEILKNLEFKVLDTIEKRVLIEVPSWRLDITKEIDVIEEVARFMGFENIQSYTPLMDIRGIDENPFITFIENARISFAHEGFVEVMNFPFISSKDLAYFNINNNHVFSKVLTLLNPLAENENLISPLLSILLFKALINNKHRGDRGIKLFECARVYANYLEYGTNLGMLKQNPWPFNAKTYHLQGKAIKDARPCERHMIAAIIDQPLMLKNWDTPEVKADFFYGKQICVAFLNKFNIKSLKFVPIQTEIFSFLNAAAAAQIYCDDVLLGYVGEIHPQVLKNYDVDINDAPILLELCLENVFEVKNKSYTYSSQISKFPSVERDIAFVIDENINYALIEEFFNSLVGQGNLISFRLFDVYKGSNVPPGKKSMGVSLTFQSLHKTLTDSEIEAQIGKIIKSLTEKLNVSLRT